MNFVNQNQGLKAKFTVRLLVTCLSIFVTNSEARAGEVFCREALQIRTPIFTADSSRYSIDLTRLRDTRDNPETKIKVESDGPGGFHNYQLGNLAPFENYVNELRTIHSEIESHGTNTEKVDAVFYPLMGTDIALPLLVFPKAKTIVTIDRMPFLPVEQAKDNSPIEIKPAIGGAWRAAVHITQEASVASRLLGALFDSYPKVKIKSLQIIESRDSKASAILRFDLGDGEGERSLIYINEAVTQDSVQIQNVLGRVWQTHPQAAIFKASMGLAKGGGYGGPPREFGINVLKQMKQQNGVTLEGLATEVAGAGGYQGRHDAELSGPVPALPVLSIHDHRLSYILPNHKFGYDVGVLVTDFAQVGP